LGEKIAVLRGQGKALASATETAEIERHGILRHCSPTSTMGNLTVQNCAANLEQMLVGVCPHDNCILQGNDPGFRGDYGGWWCPICAAHFDTSGRTRTGPAQQNLPIPPYRFLTSAKLVLVPEILARVGQID
jgi:hypothetical protein